MSSAARLTAIVVVSVSALSTLAALMPANAHAAGCTDSWAKPVSGEWNTAADWSTGKVPTSGDEVCIMVSGTYTVLVHNLAEAHTLTLGASSGSTKQTLLVQTYELASKAISVAGLTFEENSTINRDGVLELEDLVGGDVDVNAPPRATLSNQGEVTNSASTAPSSIDILEASLTNEASGTVEAAAGTFYVSRNDRNVLNEGAFKVATGATLNDAANSGTFVNSGTVANGGTFELEAATAWTQDGVDTGNPVRVEGGSSLDYEGGSGNFDLVGSAMTLSGTIPKGQALTFEPTGDRALSISETVVNEGTLTAVSSIPGSETHIQPENGASKLENKGLISVQSASTGPVTWTVPLTNEVSGTVEVDGGGELISDATTTNEGTLELASDAIFDISGSAAALTDEADGTLRVDVASETKFGRIKVNGGTFNPGGTIFPNLVEGYDPPVGTEFDVVSSGASISGTFETVANGFEGIYSIPDTIAVERVGPTKAEEEAANKKAPEEAAVKKETELQGVTTTTAAKMPSSGVVGSQAAALPAPKLAVTGNLAPVSGSVLVKLPGSSTFVALTTAEQIPFGTVVNATHGRVSVTTAGPHGGTQTAEFFEGEFILTQGRNGLVVATLTGGDFAVCPTARERSHVARASSRYASGKHVVRKLWANAHGSFSTKGNYAAGAVEGTEWLTEDLCEGTLIRVTRDRVLVTNLVNHRHVTVKAKHRYLAKAP